MKAHSRDPGRKSSRRKGPSKNFMFLQFNRVLCGEELACMPRIVHVDFVRPPKQLEKVCWRVWSPRLWCGPLGESTPEDENKLMLPTHKFEISGLVMTLGPDFEGDARQVQCAGDRRNG